MFRMKITLYDLEVSIEAQVGYPDAIDDLANRVTHSFLTALMGVKESGIELFKLIDEDADEFDD